MTIPLSEVAYVAKSKPPGFFEEALKRGRVKDACLELNDSDVAFLKSFSSEIIKDTVPLGSINIESSPSVIAESVQKLQSDSSSQVEAFATSRPFVGEVIDTM
jgi:hypothetical protein